MSSEEKAPPSVIMNVLVVDDESNIRKTMMMFFEMRQHKVTTVSNIKDALTEAGLQIFDLAFVDIRLGLESGLDLVSSLLAKSPWLKIVVMTAFASVDTAVEAMKRGAADYLPKPFMPGQLKLVLERLASIRTLEPGYLTELQSPLYAKGNRTVPTGFSFRCGRDAPGAEWHWKDHACPIHPLLESKVRQAIRCYILSFIESGTS